MILSGDKLIICRARSRSNNQDAQGQNGQNGQAAQNGQNGQNGTQNQPARRGVYGP